MAVVVLGDLGRSPRMQNQVAALARHGQHDVHFIGHDGVPCPKHVSSNPNVIIRPLGTSVADQWQETAAALPCVCRA